MTLSTVVEHLSMVVFAIVIAILIGVPLGLLCYLCLLYTSPSPRDTR